MKMAGSVSHHSLVQNMLILLSVCFTFKDFKILSGVSFLPLKLLAAYNVPQAALRCLKLHSWQRFEQLPNTSMRDSKGSCGSISFSFSRRNVKVFRQTETSRKRKLKCQYNQQALIMCRNEHALVNLRDKLLHNECIRENLIRVSHNCLIFNQVAC